MVAVTEFTQIYLNELDSPVEAVYEFPTDADMTVSKLVIELGDRVV